MNIKKRHLDILRGIKRTFLKKTRVPHPGAWKSYSDDDIWLGMVCQVTVVGRSSPADKLLSDKSILRKVNYSKLCKIQDNREIAARINQALRAIGTRYASRNILKCMKTNALLHNFNILRKLKRGPRGLFERLAKFDGPNKDMRRIKYIMKTFKYMKSTSARDFLMDKGIIRNAVAIGQRIQNIFKAIGLELPDEFAANPVIYNKVEKDILHGICAPLGLDGIQFDRMLYQNYDAIMEYIAEIKLKK